MTSYPIQSPEPASLLGFSISAQAPSVGPLNKTVSTNIPTEHTYYALLDTNFPKLIPLPDTSLSKLLPDNPLQNAHPSSNNISPIFYPTFNLFPYYSIFEYSTSSSSSLSIPDSVYNLPASNPFSNLISVYRGGTLTIHLINLHWALHH